VDRRRFRHGLELCAKLFSIDEILPCTKRFTVWQRKDECGISLDMELRHETVGGLTIPIHPDTKVLLG
jgi:hypothetical protein